MRNAFAETVFELACSDDKIAAIVADISPAGAMNEFRSRFPSRFVNTGVAEQIMIGMAAGMAMEGMKPFAYTIATFALYRPFEFIRDDICYQQLPVTVVGMGAGLGYPTLGATHQAIEDVSVALSIAGLSVLAPCDPYETRELTKICASGSLGPTYMRIGKAGEPELSEKGSESDVVVGRFRRIRRGKDIAIVGYGPSVKVCLEVADALRDQASLTASVYSAHTINPIQESFLEELFGIYDRIVCVEEMIQHGGLADVLRRWRDRADKPVEIIAYGLRKEFLHVYGSQADLAEAHGLTSRRISADLLVTLS